MTKRTIYVPVTINVISVVLEKGYAASTDEITDSEKPAW